MFTKAEAGSADLVVKVFAANGTLLAATPVLSNALPSVVVDVTIPAEVRQPPSLFEKFEQALKPFLGFESRGGTWGQVLNRALSGFGGGRV